MVISRKWQALNTFFPQESKLSLTTPEIVCLSQLDYLIWNDYQ